MEDIMGAIVRNAIMIVGVFGILGAIAGSGEARSVSAFMGQAQSFADGSSFYNTRGIVVGNSATTKQWCLAMPVETNNHTIYVWVKSPDINHNIQCQAWALSGSGTITWAGGWLSPPTMGVNYSMNLGTVSVIANGGLYACCNMPQGAAWDSANW
jgi:hypothetical protein